MGHSWSELRARHIQRLAKVLHGHWEEKSGGHTRLIDTIVPPYLCFWGGTPAGLTCPSRQRYVEHIVPCKWLRDEEAFRLFDAGANIEQVADRLGALLYVAWLTKEEARALNRAPGLKTGMGTTWDGQKECITARLEEVGLRAIRYPFGSEVTGQKQLRGGVGAETPAVIRLRGGGRDDAGRPRRWEFVRGPVSAS